MLSSIDTTFPFLGEKKKQLMEKKRGKTLKIVKRARTAAKQVGQTKNRVK